MIDRDLSPSSPRCARRARAAARASTTPACSSAADVHVALALGALRRRRRRFGPARRRARRPRAAARPRVRRSRDRARHRRGRVRRGGRPLSAAVARGVRVDRRRPRERASGRQSATATRPRRAPCACVGTRLYLDRYLARGAPGRERSDGARRRGPAGVSAADAGRGLARLFGEPRRPPAAVRRGVRRRCAGSA